MLSSEFLWIGLPSGEIYMKRIALSLLAFATVAGMASPALAFDWKTLPVFSHWNIDSLASNEQARINAGRANGSLTPDEYNRLQSRLNDINLLKARLSRGGLNPGEASTIDAQLDQLSQDIYRESNDRQMLGSKPYSWSNKYNPNNGNWRYGHWDNGKWVSKNNWDHYSNWKQQNWQSHWDNKDGVPGAQMTSQEQWQIDKDKAHLQEKAARMSADGHLSPKDRENLNRQQQRINEKERIDRNN